MMIRKYLALLQTLVLLAPLAPSLAAKTHKGEKFLKEGKAAEVRGDWDTALSFYNQAVDDDPQDVGYLIAMRRARFEAGQRHVGQGQELRRQGKVTEALQEFQKAILLDPSSAMALQEIKRTQQMLANPVTAESDKGLTPSEIVRKEADEKVAAMMGPPELKPVIRTLPAIKMNNQPPRVLFETVGKVAGINVIFDSQYTPPNRGFTVEIPSSGVETMFDYLAMVTHTYWKPISPTSIFVTEDNVTKRRDYEDEVVKVFYVTNTSTVQEFQEIATAIRTLADIRRVFTYNAQKALIVRGTVDQVALTEKLIHDLDKPKAEVIIDVIVMEANSTRTRDLAATIVSAGATGNGQLNLPITFTPTGVTAGSGTTPAGTFPVSRIATLSIHDFSTTLPGMILSAMLSDNRTKVLNSPQVRASDGQKVSLKIGDRIPYATGSFQPGVGTVGVSPLVSTQFNFAEVGVNVDITPFVHSGSEISMHIDLEVSAVKQYVTIAGSGGLTQPVIGQRKQSTDIRLREGEVNILGGLSQTQDSTTNNGIPGLINVPILGQALFGSNHKETDRGELLIALIPHIVRTPDYSPENLRGIFAGSDQVVKINYADKPEEPAPGVPAPTGAPAAPAPAAPKPATPNPVAPAPGATAPQTPAQPTPQAAIHLLPPSVQAAVSQQFAVAIQVDGASDASALSQLRIKYDPALMRLNDIVDGGMFSRDGQRVTFVKDIRNDTGEATVSISRLPDAPGISGSGIAASLNFVAVGKGTGTVGITEAALKDTKQATQNMAVGSAPVTIQ
jgi:general secretion pathway protein D